MNEIWENIEKPPEFQNTNLEDLFDIGFYFMPPLVYYRNEFNQKVDDLYDRFTNKNSQNYIFNTPYHFQKSVPAEGLPSWTKQIWDAIMSDEALNIPDQQKLLSAYRCEHALEVMSFCFFLFFWH